MNIRSLYLQDLLISAGDLADWFLLIDRVDQDGRQVNVVGCTKCLAQAVDGEELAHAPACLAGRVAQLCDALRDDVGASRSTHELYIAYLEGDETLTHEQAAMAHRGVLA